MTDTQKTWINYAFNGLMIGLLAILVSKSQPTPTPKPTPTPAPVVVVPPEPIPDHIPPVPLADATLVPQVVALTLSDGTKAKFHITSGTNGLVMTAAIGRDTVLQYDLCRVADDGPQPIPPTPVVPPAPVVVPPVITPPKPADPPIPVVLNPTGAVATLALVAYEGNDAKAWKAADVAIVTTNSNIPVIEYDKAHSHDLANGPGWIAYCAAKGLPWMVFLDDKGAVLYETKAVDPTTLIAAFKAFAGKPKAEPKGHYEKRCNGKSCVQVWVEDK